MHDFFGTVFLIDDPDSVLDAKVTVDLNRVLIKSDDAEIGSWRHSDVEIKSVGGQVHLVADGETLVLQLEGQDFFLDLLGVNEPAQKKSRRRRRKQPDYEAERRTPFSLVDMKAKALSDRADRIDKRLAIAIGIASAVVLAGAAFSWGPFRLMDAGSFPIGRLLAGFGGLGGLVGLYLGYFDRSRISGSAATISAGIVTFCVAYLYTRSARLGFGFVLTLLGSQALIAAGIIGLMGRDRRDGETEPDPATEATVFPETDLAE